MARNRERWKSQRKKVAGSWVYFVNRPTTAVRESDSVPGQPAAGAEVVEMSNDWVVFDDPGEIKNKPQFIIAKDKANQYYVRFGKEYDEWVATRETGGGSRPGTPLEDFSGFTLGELDALEAQGFAVLEEFADLSEQNLSRAGILNPRQKREAVKEFLAVRSRVAPIEVLQKQIADLQQQLIGSGGASVGNLGALIEAAVEKALSGSPDNGGRAKPPFARRRNGTAEVAESAD
jgi:hypothetical protein